MLDYLRRRPTTTAELEALDIQWRQNIEAYKANILRDCEVMDLAAQGGLDFIEQVRRSANVGDRGEYNFKDNKWGWR